MWDVAAPSYHAVKLQPARQLQTIQRPDNQQFHQLLLSLQLQKKSLRLTRVCKTVWFTISVLTTKQLQLATELGSSSLTHSVTLQVFTYLVDCSLAHCCLVRDAHSLSGRSLETIRLPYWFCGDNRPIKLMNIYAVSLTDSKHCTTESAVSVVSV